MNVVEAKGLRKCYGSLVALAGLDLGIPKGSLCALVGPNGAGKSSTLRLAGGLLRPDGGSIKVLGIEAGRLGAAERLRIGYLDEAQQQPDHMTVRGYLDFCSAFYPNWDRALEQRLLKVFELPLDRRLSKLSRGMRMKALLVSVLAFHPELLLMDEPFSGFDPVVREDVTRGLLEVVQSGECTVLLSSHDIEEVERIADRIVMIDSGHKLLDESVESLLSRHRRLVVNLQGGSEHAEAGLPASWGPLRREGEQLEWVDSGYEAAACEAACRARFPEAACTARPMSLREIYLHQARSRAGQGRQA